MTTSETISLTRWIFVGKVMSLLSNMRSRLVISFLPRSKGLLISWLQTPSAVTLEPLKIKSLTLCWHYWRPPPRKLIPYPGLLNPEPQPQWQATADLYLHRSHSNTQGQVWLSLCGFSWWAHFLWALWASLAGMGFDSKHNFAPPAILLGHLLCPWMWDISSKLLKVPHTHRSSTYHLAGVSLPLDVGSLLTIAPVPKSRHRVKYKRK